MDNVIDWLNAKPASSRTASLAGLVIVPVLLVVAVGLFFAPAAPFFGAIAGAALFIAAFGYWHTVLPADQQAKTDLKAKFDLKPRRGIVAAALAVWVILLFLLGPYAPGPLLGTLNVFVAISAYWVWRATPTEAAEALARYEAAQAAKEAQAALDAEDDDNYDDYDAR